MSRIPSDLFVMRNPSLGITKDPVNGKLTVVSKPSQRLLNAQHFQDGFTSRVVDKDGDLLDEAAFVIDSDEEKNK